MRLRRKFLIGIGPLLGVAIAGYVAYSARTATLTDEEWDICEAVLRYQIFHSTAAGRGTATAYVEVQDLNQTDAFLSRFQGHTPPVKPAWRRFLGIGVLYKIGPITRIGEDSAEVFGAYYEGSLSASGVIYYVARKDGRWVVDRSHELWII